MISNINKAGWMKPFHLKSMKGATERNAAKHPPAALLLSAPWDGFAGGNNFAAKTTPILSPIIRREEQNMTHSSHRGNA